MIAYVKAENLKQRRTFLKKLLWLAPLMLVLLAFALMPAYFTVNAYNWWYVMLLPAIVALIPAMMHQKEARYLNYRALYPLNVNLEKVWYAKILIAISYLCLAEILHLLGVFSGQLMLPRQLTEPYSLISLTLASLVLLITSLWQVPFCFFLAKKLGLVASVVGNTILGIFLGLLFVESSWWLLCPYSWGMRAMIVMLNILPNGIPLKSSLPMVNNVIFPCILALLLFIVLSLVSAKWFSKQEVV